jgi:hypothetical protein
MKIGKWLRLMVTAAPLMAGCGDFWQNPNGTNGGAFSLSNSGNISVSPGASSGNTSTITVTPASTFTGTVTLTCAVTGPSNATSPATCGLSPTSVSITDTNSQTATLTAATTSTTTVGAYQMTITGVSGSTTETTTVCAEVSTSSGTCNAAPGGASGNFYILNEETNQIAGYNIASGALATITGSPYALSAKPFSLAVDPTGSYLYVGTAAGIYLYLIDPSTGALTLGNGNGVLSTDLATTMQVDSTGSWLVEAGPGLGEVLAVPLDPSTGLIGSGSEQNAILPATTVQQLAISPDNSNVFIALGAGGTAVISFTSSNTNPFGSTATTIPVKHTGGSALSVAVDSSNRVFYLGETLGNSAGNAGGLRVFNYASLTSTLTESTGSPYSSGGLAPNAILSTASGNYTYVANGALAGTAGNVTGFTLETSGSEYTLSAGSTAAVGVDPLGLAEDSTGAYILVVSSGGNPDLAAFSFDTTIPGELDSVLTAATGTDPVEASAIAAAP